MAIHLCPISKMGIGVVRDLCKVFVYYQKLAEMAKPARTCNVGYCYVHGIGVETNIRKARMYYQKAAEMGDIYALDLGKMVFQKNGLREVSP
ncbi:sel1 repeat family protein [Gigaspora margarita]|uniref:Sel1 repeat family protein n=1 Tax=Gigaspora margarita TaxID=4874 RepID=A0A8H3WXH1_GIGMA|nr:sel1 repeat family protein [Gigaspora margarita]